jgi:hypothetical protein
MKRTLIVVVLLGLPAVAAAQTQLDEITFYDRAKKKEDVHRGVVQQDSVAGLVCRVGTTPKTVTFAAGDIIDVRHGLRGAIRSVYDRGRTAELAMDAADSDEERAKQAQDALKRYQDLLKEKDVEGAASIQRHLQYRIARVSARLAEDGTEQRDAAIAALEKFVKAHNDCWQFSGAVRQLGRLQEDKGDLAAAQKTYDLMAARLEAPKEMRLEFQMLSVRGLIDTKQYPAAEKMLVSMNTMLGKDDPLVLRVQAFQAELQAAAKKYDDAQTKLAKVLASDQADEVTRGLAHNVLGDCLRETGKLEDAFWNYLWVDVLYNQDRQEQARALYHLSKLFEQVKKNPARAQQCRERLLTKEFAGTDYQRRAVKEK